VAIEPPIEPPIEPEINPPTDPAINPAIESDPTSGRDSTADRRRSSTPVGRRDQTRPRPAVAIGGLDMILEEIDQVVDPVTESSACPRRRDRRGRRP